MTDTLTFIFGVKPGQDPVHIRSMSAHDRLPWVAQGYEFHTVEAVIHLENIHVWYSGKVGKVELATTVNLADEVHSILSKEHDFDFGKRLGRPI